MNLSASSSQQFLLVLAGYMLKKNRVSAQSNRAIEFVKFLDQFLRLIQVFFVDPFVPFRSPSYPSYKVLDFGASARFPGSFLQDLL